MNIKRKKPQLFAIIGYCIPLVLFILAKFPSKWGADIENCISAFNSCLKCNRKLFCA